MMETLIIYSREKKNNLELYLNDVYEKECVFKIEEEEIEFIQTGIETLVQDLVDKILADDSIHKLISDRIDKSPKFLKREKSIAEVYFPIQSDSCLQRYVGENASYVKSTIIKVGSFYDGTKNNFPDEFDFIFPFLGVRRYNATYFPYQNFSDVYQTICKYAKHIHDTSPSKKHEITRELKLDEHVGRHGPAFKLQFIYSNGLGKQKDIHVDLVPAIRIIDSNTLEWFAEIREYVEPKTFREEILAAGSSLIVKFDLAFTDIEQHFMKNILSKKHVKVYRVLKYLINGHVDGERLEEHFRSNPYKPYYTSYRIKILIIYHHETCTSTDTEDLGPCVLQVLEEMSKYENTGDFPKFNKSLLIANMQFKMLPYLKSTLTTLRSLQIAEDSYDYDNDRIEKSVSGQYLEFLNQKRRLKHQN